MPVRDEVSPGTNPAGEWPFLGRDAELQVVLRGLDPDDAKGAAGAVVVAPAGVGKTRLLRETRRRAEDLGMPTATVLATDAASRTPYGAVLHLLPDDLADAISRAGWHASFASALRTDDGHPMVMFVDDAQHLDDGSASLLLHLTLQGVVLPVISVRAGERAPDPVTLLWKDALCLRVDLQPLTGDELIGLIREVLGGRVSERTLSRLATVCDGNVLYARELVTAAIMGGSLRRSNGIWVWDEKVVLAPRLVDAVGGRLEALTDAERRALALVALGQPLPVGVAERITTPSPLVSLEEAGLIKVTGPAPDGDLRLGHPMYGEVTLDQLGRLSRRELVASLAGAVEADPDHASRSVVQIATWRLDAGLPTHWRTLHQAAVRANHAFDHVLAVRLGRAAIEAVDTDDSASRAAVTVELSRALVGCNESTRAHTLLRDVEESVLTSTNDDLVDAYVDVRFWASYHGLGLVGDALQFFDRLGAHPDASRYRDRFAAYRACLALGDGQPQRAVELAEPVLETEASSHMQQLLALETTGEALACLGLVGRAERVWDRMRELSANGTGRAAVAGAEAELQSLFLAMLDGRVSDALPGLAALHEQVEDSGDVVNRGLACLAFGRGLLLAGQAERARGLLLDAVADFNHVDLGGTRAWALALLSQVDALTGRVAEGVRSGDDVGSTSPQGGDARIAADLVAGEVWSAVAEGDRTRASALALAGAERYPGLPLSRAWLLHLATRVGDNSRDVVDALREIADSVECDGPALLADHASAARSGDGRALEAAAEDFHARGLVPLAAEAAQQAVRAHREGGSAAGVRRAAARAALLTEHMDPISTPGLSDPMEPAVLSRRERDVAGMAASGLTNAAIAEQLVVSVRTVESHLYQAFAKLGVESRTELHRYLPGTGSGPSATDQ